VSLTGSGDKNSTNDDKKDAQEMHNYIEKESQKESFKQEEDNRKTHVRTVTQRVTSRNGKGFKLVKRKVKCTKNEYDKYMAKKELLEREKKLITPNMDDFIKEPLMVKFKRMKDVTLQDTVREMIPPADIFHRFLYYFESNYEELLVAVRDLYCEKPDLDWAINPLKMVKDLDEARKFRRKYDGQINWPIMSVNKGNWNVFGPYKENRDRLDFYGSNMGLFEEMYKKNEKDRELGAQIMGKKKTKLRRAQEKRMGKSEVRPGMNPVTNVSQFMGKEIEDQEFDEEDRSVMQKVIHFSDGGRTMVTDEFPTEYTAQVHMVGGPSNN